MMRLSCLLIFVDTETFYFHALAQGVCLYIWLEVSGFALWLHKTNVTVKPLHRSFAITGYYSILGCSVAGN